MKTLNSIIGTLVVVGTTVFSAPSEAASQARIAINHASVACSGTTANYDRYLVERPQALGNNGGTTALVQCGGVATPQDDYYGMGDIVVYEVGLSNPTTSPMTISCSLTDGLQDALHSVLPVWPKSVTVAAGGVASISWNGLDMGGSAWNNGTKFQYPAVTCQLPSKGEIVYTGTLSYADVGQ